MVTDEVRVEAAALEAFTRDVFIRVGMPSEDAAVEAEVLVWANLRGVDSHGVLRIPSYVEMVDKGDMNPHAAAHYGAFVFKPVQPLSAIDPGLDPFVGVFVFLEAHKQQLARYRPIEDAAPTRRLGLLTPATAALMRRLLGGWISSTVTSPSAQAIRRASLSAARISPGR